MQTLVCLVRLFYLFFFLWDFYPASSCVHAQIRNKKLRSAKLLTDRQEKQIELDLKLYTKKRKHVWPFFPLLLLFFLLLIWISSSLARVHAQIKAALWKTSHRKLRTLSSPLFSWSNERRSEKDKIKSFSLFTYCLLAWAAAGRGEWSVYILPFCHSSVCVCVWHVSPHFTICLFVFSKVVVVDTHSLPSRHSLLSVCFHCFLKERHVCVCKKNMYN